MQTVRYRGLIMTVQPPPPGLAEQRKQAEYENLGAWEPRLGL